MVQTHTSELLHARTRWLRYLCIKYRQSLVESCSWGGGCSFSSTQSGWCLGRVAFPVFGEKLEARDSDTGSWKSAGIHWRGTAQGKRAGRESDVCYSHLVGLLLGNSHLYSEAFSFCLSHVFQTATCLKGSNVAARVLWAKWEERLGISTFSGEFCFRFTLLVQDDTPALWCPPTHRLSNWHLQG